MLSYQCYTDGQLVRLLQEEDHVAYTEIYNVMQVCSTSTPVNGSETGKKQ